MISEATGASAPPTDRGLRWDRVAGLGALVGGTFWVIKSAATLATGDQPPLFFELAPVPLALAAFGLARLAASAAAAALGVTALVAGGLYSLSWLAGMDSPAFGLVLLAGMLSLHGALVLAGPSLLRRRALGRWSAAPLAIGLATVPLLVLGGAMASTQERLVELPLLVLGVAWVAFGAALCRTRPRASVG